MNFINSYQRARILLATGSILCFIAFWWSAKLLRIQIYPGYQSSLLLAGSNVLPLLATALFWYLLIMMAICVAVGTAVAGMVRFNAGLLTATLGLAALSFRGGKPRQTILWADSIVGPGAMYLRFIGELLILSFMIGAAWWVLRKLYSAGKLKDRETAAMASAEGDLLAEISSLAV